MASSSQQQHKELLSKLPAPALFADLDKVNDKFLTCPPLRWGIMSCGRVAHDFVQALKHVPSAEVRACATSASLERAQAFATKHQIPTAYGSYQELVQDPSIDIVYVANLHYDRRADGELVLGANKHCLLEKPFATNAEDAQYLINLAKERNLFIMEGMWTRCFPVVELAKQLILGTGSASLACGNGGGGATSISGGDGNNNDDVAKSSGMLGDVVSVFSDFNFDAKDNGDGYPDSIFFNKKMGGGATLFAGVYPISIATLFFHGRIPDQIKAVGQVDDATKVDLQAALVLSWAPTSTIQPHAAAKASSTNNDDQETTPKLPGAGVASLSYGLLGETDETTTIICTKGRVTIQTPSHCPTSISVRMKGQGRGVAGHTFDYTFPLPPDTPAIIEAGGYMYPNSAGFAYEAAAIARCIAAGKVESDQYTHADTLVEMHLVDQVRRQLGA